MKNHAVLGVSILTLVAGGLGSAPSSHELTDSERAQVEAQVIGFLGSYLDTLEGDDPDAIRGLYVDDERFAWFTDGEKRYRSADEVLESLASMEGLTFSTETSEVEVLPLTPRLAHASSSFHTQITQAGAVVFEYGGVITWLLEEVGEGEWRVLTGHSSTLKPH